MDARASVFVTVAMWVLHLAHHGSLTWWVLENVSGIRKRRRGEPQSFADWFLEEMLPALPTGWRIDVVEHNSCWCLLPQSRPRVFFIGTSDALRQTPLQRRLLSTPPLSRPRVDIIHFLDHRPSPEDWGTLTLRQQVNMLAQLQSFQPSCAEDATVAIVDVARDPFGQVDATAVVGGARTLRTNCAYLGEHQG
jgi:site-specific DNA-cytosine methylase